MEFESVVLKRRMVRNFRRDEAVKDSDLKKIMELAQHAPSAGFSQGMAYVVITDSETKKKIGGEDETYGNGFHNFVSYAPVLIVVCVSEKIYHRRYNEPDKLDSEGKEIYWPTPYWFFDAGAASMIILLAAVDLGYAAAFAGISEIPRVREVLGIPEEFHPVGTISIGRGAPDKKSPSLKRGRRDASLVVHYEHW